MKDRSLVSPAIKRYLRIWIWIDIFVVFLISFLDIIGWIFDIPLFRSAWSNWKPMMPVTAICFLLSAVSLLFIREKWYRGYHRVIPSLLGITVSIIAILSILDYAGHLITGNEFFNSTFPGFTLFFDHNRRMAFVTAMIFLFLGIVIFLQTSRSSVMANIAHLLIIGPLIVSYLVPLSYILGVSHVHGIEALPVSLNTGIAFCFVCLALVSLRTDTWLMKILTGYHAGSLMFRRLLPGLIILPLFIGWFRIYGEQTGLYKSDVGVALVAMTYTVGLIWLVWVTASSVNKTDRERIRNQAMLTEAQRIGNTGNWEWNIHTGEFVWSDQMFQIFGENKKHFIPTFDKFLLHIHPDDRKYTEDMIREAIAANNSFTMEYRINSPGGGIRHVITRGDVWRDQNNHLLSCIGTVLDITELKNAHEALRASQERFFTTLSSIGDAVIATDVHGNITFLNRIGEEITGWNLQEASGRPVMDVFNIINENTHLEVESPVKRVLDTGMIVGLANHTVLIRKDGTEIPIDDSGAPIRGKDGNTIGVVLVFRDITERKKSEKLIRYSEQRLRFHFENSPLAIVEWDSGYIVTQWSLEAERLFGWSREETIGKPIGSLGMVFEDDLPLVENTMKRLSSGIERTVVSTNRNYTKKGSVIVCTWYNSILVDENGEMESVMSLVQDITDRQKAEVALRQARTQLEQKVEERTTEVNHHHQRWWL